MAFSTAARPHYEWKETFCSGFLPVVSRQWNHVGNFQRHDHDFFEIQLPIQGSGEHLSEEGTSLLKRGRCYLLRPGSWHAFKSRRFTSLLCAFESTVLPSYLPWSIDHPSLHALLWQRSDSGVFEIDLTEPEVKKLERHFLSLESESTDPQRGAPALILGDLLIILGMLGAAWQRKHPTSPAATPVHSSVKRAVQLLESSLDEPWTTSLLAKKLNMNASYLCDIFRSATGMTIKYYLESRRLENASYQLRQTEASIGDIANGIGWIDQTYFTRRFRKRFGMTPSDYRDKNRSA